jgi:DNA transposition AAA+ family ATPase
MRHTAVVRSRLLRQRLPETRGLIVVDEADWLSLDAVEELRILREECGVGLALVGNHKVYDRLTGGQRSVDFARLFSRVSKKYVINTVSAGDVDSFCDAWQVTGTEERKLLKAIARRPERCAPFLISCRWPGFTLRARARPLALRTSVRHAGAGPQWYQRGVTP